MTFGNSFAYFNNMPYGFGCNNYYNYGSNNYGSYMRYDSYTPLFSSFNYGMGSGYGNYYSGSYFGGNLGLYDYSNYVTRYSYSNPFSLSSYGYWNVNTGWFNANSGFCSYSPSPGDDSITSRFMSITSKYSRTSAPRTALSSSSSVGSTSLGALNVGTAKNINAYTANNKVQNAGKLSGLSAFKDCTGRVEMCNPLVVDTLVDLAKEAEKHGCKLVVTSSFRTYSEQEALVRSKGLYGKRLANGKLGVAAAAGTSPHEYGQAIDFAIYKGNKQLSISLANTPWVTNCLKSHGMTWGGNYKTVRESWHFNTSNASAYRAKLKSRSSTA